MADAIDTGNEALRRELVDETLEECERLLAAAEADATEIRHTAQRHAQERAEGAARALTAAAERIHQEATADQESAREARERAGRHLEEAQRLRDRMDGELAAAATAREEAEAALTGTREETQRLTALAESRLAAVDDEVERLMRDRTAEAERASAALLDDARRMAADLLGDAEMQASKQLEDASAAAGALLAEARQQAVELVQAASAQQEQAGKTNAAGRQARADDEELTRRAADAERAASERLARADSEATRQLLDALEEARRIVTSAEDEAAGIRARAEAHARPLHMGREPEDGSSVEAVTPSVVSTPRRRTRWQRGARATFVVGVVLVASALLRSYVAEPYTVALSSMEPALSDGDHFVLNKVAYVVSEPARGDVVVFDTKDLPGADGAPSQAVVKRVVGLPGEVVQGLDDQLVVDGEVIDDPWHGPMPTPTFRSILVPEGMVFVLGDNRALSVDSRTFGVVPIEALMGRVDVVIWPPDRAGRV